MSVRVTESQKKSDLVKEKQRKAETMLIFFEQKPYFDVRLNTMNSEQIKAG